MRDMPMMLTCSSRRNSIWRRTAAGGLWGTAWTSHIHLCRQICELRDKFRGFSKTNETGRNSRKCLTYGNKTWIMNLWSHCILHLKRHWLINGVKPDMWFHITNQTFVLMAVTYFDCLLRRVTFTFPRTRRRYDLQYQTIIIFTHIIYNWSHSYVS